MLDLSDKSDRGHCKLLVNNQVGILARSLIIVFKKDIKEREEEK